MAQSAVAPKIIIIPSPLIRAETYFGLKEPLQKFGRVGVLELPETGDYGSMKKVWYPEDYARWISSFISERNFQDLILIGHSNSGPIVTKVASLIPDRIQGLILADSIGFEDQKGLQVLQGRLRDAFQELRFSFRAFPHLLKNIFAHPRNFFLHVGLSHKDLKENLFPEDLKHPVFLAWGEKDHTMPVDLAYQMKVNFPNVDFYISKTGSHDWILTNPKEFSRAIEEWMGQTMRSTESDTELMPRMAEDFKKSYSPLDPLPPPS